jgi:hypothetical protein
VLPLIEHWNGQRWSIVASPNPKHGSAVLTDVSCPTIGFCVAVGYTLDSGNGSVFVETLRHGTWRRTSAPAPAHAVQASLIGVDCPARDLCVAVGDWYSAGFKGRTLIERWDGTQWHLVNSPNRGTQPLLNSVSCATVHRCAAVGVYETTDPTHAWSHVLVEMGGPRSWSLVPMQASRSSELDGVACPDTQRCLAVGNASLGPFIESWNGTQWTRVPRGSAPADPDWLYAITCTAVNRCEAAGIDMAGFRDRTLIVDWNGSSLSAAATPNPSGFRRRELFGVSCAGSTCFAVGFIGNGAALGPGVAGGKTLIIRN